MIFEHKNYISQPIFRIIAAFLRLFRGERMTGSVRSEFSGNVSEVCHFETGSF